jgi:hypothetical protein
MLCVHNHFLTRGAPSGPLGRWQGNVVVHLQVDFNYRSCAQPSFHLGCPLGPLGVGRVAVAAVVRHRVRRPPHLCAAAPLVVAAARQVAWRAAMRAVAACCARARGDAGRPPHRLQLATCARAPTRASVRRALLCAIQPCCHVCLRAGTGCGTPTRGRMQRA